MLQIKEEYRWNWYKCKKEKKRLKIRKNDKTDMHGSGVNVRKWEVLVKRQEKDKISQAYRIKSTSSRYLRVIPNRK